MSDDLLSTVAQKNHGSIVAKFVMGTFRLPILTSLDVASVTVTFDHLNI